MESTLAKRAAISASVDDGRRYEPLMPTSLGWAMGFYLGTPLFLLVIISDLRETARLPNQLLSLFVSTLAIGGLVHVSYVWLMPRVLARLSSRPARFAAHGSAILFSVGIGNVVVAPLLPMLCESTRGKTLQDVLIGVTVTSVVVLATTSYMSLLNRTRAIEKREQEAQRAALVAELQALQARTNPHFLFNSLNTVASLIHDDPDCAEATLERLSDLFRYALDSSRRTRVSLERELDVVGDYLEVEATRLGARLSWRVEVDPEVVPRLNEVQIPPLTLQPLVENAILHGVALMKEGGEVAVSVHHAAGELTIEVQNDVPDRAPDSRGCGTALADLERRLDVFSGGRARLEHGSVERRYVVRVRLPFAGAAC